MVELGRSKVVGGKGTIVQLEKGKARSRCRTWQLRAYAGEDPATGKQRTVTRRFHGAYKEAEAAMRSLIEEVRGPGARRARSGVTFADECARQLRARRESGNYSENRMRKLESSLKVACSRIGSTDVAKVTPEQLNRLYRDLMAGKTPSGRPASGTYAKSIHAEVSLVFKQAVRDGVCDANPCDRATPPKCDTEPRRALSTRQLQDLVSALDPADESQMAYLLAVGMGMRRGEVCGLSWGDVDLEEGALEVRRSFDGFGNLKDPKTGAGRRVLPLTPHMQDALGRHRDAQLARGLPCGGDDPVVVTGVGSRMNPDILSRRWARDRKELGAEGFTLHELRHSYLTMLARAGVHPSVSQLLAGHSDPALTLRIYTHVGLEEKREAAMALSQALEKAS